MNNLFRKIQEINFRLESLEGQKASKKQELVKKEKCAEKINDRIVELNVEIIGLTNQKTLYENKKQILKETKDEAQVSAGIMSMLLTAIPTAIMGLTTFNYEATMFCLLFCSVTVVPTSVITYYNKYSKVKKQINKIDYQTILKELNIKQQEFSLENQKYDVYEKQMLEINNILEEIEEKIDRLLEDKLKVKEILNEEVNKVNNTIIIDSNSKQKKMIFRKNKKDV